MDYQWKVLESRTELLQAKLNDLQSKGYEVVKIDLLAWDSTLRTGTYNLIARQTVAFKSPPLPVSVF